MPDIALAIDNVNKIYKSRGKPPVHAVKSLKMEIAQGEIVALLGSSGCGKTSILRMIAGFEGVSTGSIRLAGRHIEQLAPAKRNVAMAFEGYSLYPPLTVRDNIGFALKSSALKKADVTQAVDDVAALLEIEPLLDRYPSSISGGQQQRASLARALVRRADLYLLDEPMGQLEPQLRALLRGRLKNLLAERQMTTIFVTHDQTEANALADRIAVMEGGVLQQFANQQELKDSPANLFVATFVGEPPMNVFEAALTIGERVSFSIANGPVLEYPASEFPQPVREAIGARQQVVVGIRPHSVRLGAAGHKAQVVSNQWLGDQTHISLDVGGKLLVVVSHTPVDAKPGEGLSYSISAENLHVFDSQSGAALSHGSEAAR